MNIPITAYLREKLTEVGTAGFEQLAADTGVKVSFIRKFFYGGRENPRVMTVQPLLDHFQAIDRKTAPRRRTPKSKDTAPSPVTQEAVHG